MSATFEFFFLLREYFAAQSRTLLLKGKELICQRSLFYLGYTVFFLNTHTGPRPNNQLFVMTFDKRATWPLPCFWPFLSSGPPPKKESPFWMDQILLVNRF